MDERANETVEEDAPKPNKRAKVRVPKYRSVAELLGMDDDEIASLVPESDGEKLEIDAFLAAYRKGEVDWLTGAPQN